uniref:Putative homing endonuclease n=1 Tax=viral metagenome TaxID=1070528 RepID=A0A6M3KN09_9ZZZZ
MKKHVKNYFKYFGYIHQNEIMCENCGRLAVDLHHIEYGRYKRDDSVENIIALCRDCHNKAHNSEIPKFLLQETHNYKLNERRLSH